MSTFNGSTFNGSSFEESSTPLVQQKKLSLLDSVFNKRNNLGFSSANLKDREVQALDADTVRINPSVADKAFDPFVKPVDVRLKSNNFGESFNSYEINHGNESDPKVAARLSKQRDVIDNELLHGWFNPATNQDVYDRGKQAKQILSNKLKAVNEGKTGLDFALSGRDEFDRELGDMKFSNENTSAIDAMNTPELNSSYNTPFNFAKQNKDTATLGQAIEDTGRLALTGFEGIGSALGYGLEKTGIAPELGRQIQDEHFKHDEMLRNHLSDPVKQASQEPLLDENNDLNPNFGWTSLASNVIPSIPGSVVMGGAGGALAKALGVGAKAALGAETTASKLITNGLGYGTSEGVFSAAQNADQWGQEQRQKPIEDFKKSPVWNETLAQNNRDEEATKEALINQGQSDIFKDTAIKTGALSGLPGMAGGMYGELFKSVGTKITAKQALINSLKGMGAEALQEYPQSLFERRTTNQATKDYIDPNQDVSEGQWNDAAVGGLSGFAMGAMGAGGHIASIDRTKTPVDTQTPTEDNIVQPEANLKPSIEDYQASVDNITDDNRQEVLNQGIKDYPIDGTLPEKIQMASAISKARDILESPEHDEILKQLNAEIQLQNFAKGMPNFNDVIKDPNTTIEDIQDNLITDTSESTSTNTGSLFNDIGRTKDPETLAILKDISTAKQKEYALSDTVNDPYVLTITGIETKNLPKESSEVFSAITRDDYEDLNMGLNLLSSHVKLAITPEQKNTAISALTKTISKVYSDKVDITSATERTTKQALNTINGLVTNKGTITIEPSDSLEEIHRKILPTFGSQPIKNNGNEKANEIIKANNKLFTALKSTSDVSRDKLDGKGLLPSYREHLQLINILLANNAPKQVIDARVNKLAKWVEYDKGRNTLFQKLINNPKDKDSIEKELEAYQKGNPFTDNKHLVYTSGSKALAKELVNESKIMSDALADIQNQIKGDPIEEINMDDIPEEKVSNKESTLEDELNQKYSEEYDYQEQQAQIEPTSNETSNTEEDTTSEDKASVIEDLTPSKQEFTPEYKKEITNFILVNKKNLKPSFVLFKNKVKQSLTNPIFEMLKFDNTKNTLFGKYPNVFKNLFNLPELTLQTKDGLEAFKTLQKEESKFQKAFSESYKEGTFNDDPLVALTNRNVSNGKFDPNIVSAMFMGSIDWLMNKGSDTLFNFEKDIQSILSMDENTIPQNEISNALSELGSVRAMVATGLGNNIFNLMKFTASKTYPENEIAKLKLSLGLHALNTLNNMGYVTYSAVENSTFDKFKQNEVINPEVKHNLKPSELQDQSVVFVRIASDIEDKKSTIEYDLKQVLDTLKAGNKDITTMFESAYEKELPKTRKPNKASVLASLGFNEEKGKKATGLHTTQEITTERIDALIEYVQTPHTLDTPTMKLLLAMDDDVMAEMELGVDFQEQKQQSKERSYRGKVLSYEKEKEALDKLLELSDQGSKPLYFMSTFWNQGRIGGIGMGHPQNNKWIRNLSSPKNYFVKIKPSDEFAVTQFKLAVLEAFGVAAKSLTKEQIDPEFQKILTTNEEAIKQINLQKEDKEFNQRTIINAVHKGKEKAHTLNGLVALSMYSPTEEFETNIGREVDGITNGVLIGLVLLAGVENFERMKDVLAAAGLFEDPTMDYATWKSSVEGKEDNYEQIARVFAKSLNQADQTPQLLAIKHFIGELLVDDKVTKSGRNFAKPILLLTMFGKSTDKLANSVGDTVIETFYDELEKLQRDTELEWEDKVAKLGVLKKQIETILNKPLQGNEYVEGKVVRNEEDNKASLVDLTMENLLEFSLTQQDANSIIATVNHLFQPMIEEAINHNFGVTIDNRKILNDAYFVVGEVFKLGLQKELLRFQHEQYVKVHPDNLHPSRKQLEHFRANEGKEPSAEQMDKIIADLIKIQPRSPTKNSESLEQDLQLWNSERSSNHTAAYKTQTGWNSKTGKLTYQVADENGKIFTQELDLPKSTSAHALSLIVNSLGVGVTIANIHNRDSNVMIDMMKSKFKGLAVHDAFIFNLLEAVEGSKLLNSSLIDSLNSFDVFQGAVDNLERVQEYLKANPDIANELNRGFTSPTEGLFSRQRFYTKDKKTKEIVPHYNNLNNFVERLKGNQETLAKQRQEQIWNHIPKGGVKQYGGQDSYEFTEEVKPSTTQVGFKLIDKEGKSLSPQQNSKDQKKANIATHMIGFGRDKPNRKSTTVKYQEAAVVQGIPLNAGKYTKDSVAFISVSGSNAATNHDIKNTVDEALKVLNMNGSIVMDNKTNRESTWNASGEGRVFQQIVKAVGKENIINISKDTDYVQLQLKSKKTNNEALSSDYWFDSTDEESTIEEFKQQFTDANSGDIIFKYFDENSREVTEQDSPFKVAGYAIINVDKAKSLLTQFSYKGSLEEFLIESEQERFTKGSNKEKLITALYTDTSTLQTNEDNIKEGVSDIFKTNPELSLIGTQQEYSNYLNSIFPKSKFKNIVFHGTPNEAFTSFSNEKRNSNKGMNTGIWENKQQTFRNTSGVWLAKEEWFARKVFAENQGQYVGEGYVLPVIINAQTITNTQLDKISEKDTLADLVISEETTHLPDNTGGMDVTSEVYLVPDTSNTFILGTPTDLTNFKKYIKTNEGNKPLGSTPNAKDLLTEVEDLKKDITTENIVSEFDAMPKGEDETHNTFLRNFVSQIIAPVVEATELLLFSKATYTYGQYSAELKKVAINLGQALQEQYSPFKMSAQEVFAHEFVHVVQWAAYGLYDNKHIRNIVDTLFYKLEQEFNKYKARNPDDRALDKWDGYVFNNKDFIDVTVRNATTSKPMVVKYNRGIQEFLAFGSTNKEFRELLTKLKPRQLKVTEVSASTVSDEVREATWIEVISNVLKKVLDSFIRLAKGKDSLDPLIVFDKNVRLILAANGKAGYLNTTVPIVDRGDAFISEKAKDTGLSVLKFVSKGRGSKIQFIDSLGKYADTLPSIGGFETNKVIRETIKLIKHEPTRNMLLDTINDIKGTTEANKPLENAILNQGTIEGERNTATAKDVQEYQKKVGVLNDLQDTAFKNVVLSGELFSVRDNYPTNFISLLEDSKLLNQEIKSLEFQIPKLVNDTKNLASMMVLGKYTETGLGKHNAALVAKQGRNIPQDKYQKELDLVTKLSRLYAIGLQDVNHVNEIVKLLKDKSQAMNEVMNVHRENVKKAHEEGHALTIHDGEIPTSYNPFRSIHLGTKEDEKFLVDHWGATIIGNLKRDPNDSLTTPGVLYLITEKTQQDYDSKAIAFVSRNSESSNFHSGFVMTDKFKAAENREKAKLKDDGTKSTNNIKQKNNSNVSRVAIFNKQGQVIRYEYVLDKATKDKYLKPTNNAFKDLATQKNAITYTNEAIKLNKQLVDKLYNYWKELGHKARHDMIWVGSEGKYKDLWNMIPTETKTYFETKFGTEKGFYMTEEELRTVFGYRKQTITNWIQPVLEDDLKRHMGNHIYYIAKRLGFNLATITAMESMWIEGISFAKDTIVVKSGVVSAANESSNFMTAKLEGMPIPFYYENKIRAMKAEQQYRRDSDALLSHLSNAYGNPDYVTDAIHYEMEKLKSAISNNPMAFLHEEGLASTIAEENAHKDKHETKLYSKTERARNLFDKLPKVVKDTLKVATISEGTKVYTLMNEIAQMGDITSRFALIAWEAEKAKRSGTKFDYESAIDKAKFLFIQYHSVTNDKIQWGNDIGLIMFSKFGTKAIGVLAHMFGNHAGRLLALGILEDVLGASDWIWNTSLNKFAIPTSSLYAAIDASLIVNALFTPPAYIPKELFSKLGILPVVSGL